MYSWYSINPIKTVKSEQNVHYTKNHKDKIINRYLESLEACPMFPQSFPREIPWTFWLLRGDDLCCWQQSGWTHQTPLVSVEKKKNKQLYVNCHSVSAYFKIIARYKMLYINNSLKILSRAIYCLST